MPELKYWDPKKPIGRITILPPLPGHVDFRNLRPQGKKMGCDIHTYIEYRRTEGDPWAPCPVDVPTEKYDWSNVSVEKGEPTVTVVPTGGTLWGDRHYGKFAILANVRNVSYYDLKPAFPTKRGVPPDACQIHKEELDHGYFHSHTFVYLHEIMVVDWDAPLTNRRHTPPEQTTYREMIGQQFFDHVKLLTDWARANDVEPGDVRVLIAFDN